jgi:5-(carboxyamino)imidazole ribonucleotide mutase
MSNQKIVVLVGSASDMPFAHRVQDFLKEAQFPIKCEYRVNSAHRNPEKLLADLKGYEQSKDNIVYITVAGLSDSLSSVVAGYAANPVIACPPDIEKHGLPKIFSTIMTPKGIAVALVPEPENAALAAAKILALSSPSLKEIVQKHREKLKEAVAKADAELRKKKAHELEREHVRRIEHREHGEHVEHAEDKDT